MWERDLTNWLFNISYNRLLVTGSIFKSILNASDIGNIDSFAVSITLVTIGVFIDFYHYMHKYSYNILETMFFFVELKKYYDTSTMLM